MLIDLKYALRQLTKNPGFTVFAILTLALGIGANTAIFTVIDTVLLSTLPVKNPQQLVFLTDPNFHGFGEGGHTGSRDVLTFHEFQDLSEHSSVFSGLLASSAKVGDTGLVVIRAGQPDARDHAVMNIVSGDYFSVLGVNAIVGRTFTAQMDKVQGASPVAVISYRYWQDRFGGVPSVSGQKLRIDNTVYDIIGVAPKGFTGETVGWSPAVWLPVGMVGKLGLPSTFFSAQPNPLAEERWLQAIGRLKPGISVAQAQSSIDVNFRQYLESQLNGVPESRKADFLDQHIVLSAARHGASTLRQGYAEPLVILMVLVGLLLLTACTNLANLLLARATFRQREIAVRIALGAKPGRLFRQLITESVLLSIIGAGAGLLLARWADSALLQLVGQSSRRGPAEIGLQLNGGILIFTLGISVVVGVIFGLAPALQSARVDVNSALKGTAGRGPETNRIPLAKLFVVAQVALSLLLLIAAGLFVHSFQKLATADLGYDQDHLLVFGVNPTSSGYKEEAVDQLYQKLCDRIRAVPGVRDVTLSQDGLFSGNESDNPISIEGYSPTSGQDMNVNLDRVAPRYFSTVGIPILLGREIGADDTGKVQRACVINQTMARYYFGDANPIGRRISVKYSTGPYDFTVVGIAADAKYNSIREKTPRRLYSPAYNPVGPPAPGMFFEVRAAGQPSALIATIRTAVKQAAPSLRSVGIEPLSEITGQTLGLDRLLTKLSGFFGIMAAVLASIGIYGVMSYAVARRTREIGIRMALGAQRGSVLRLVLGESMVLVLVGLAIGVPAAIGAGQLIASLLFGLTPLDPPVLAAAAVAMVVVAIIASYVPALRATRVDPLVALRQE